MAPALVARSGARRFGCFGSNATLRFRLRDLVAGQGGTRSAARAPPRLRWQIPQASRAARAIVVAVDDGGTSAHTATARSIHRSVETVRRQRKSAMSKLGAHTITQAVGRAVALDLLDESVR